LSFLVWLSACLVLPVPDVEFRAYDFAAACLVCLSTLGVAAACACTRGSLQQAGGAGNEANKRQRSQPIEPPQHEALPTGEYDLDGIKAKFYELQQQVS
jgi:hypothetical protein